jgi:hypothetical protein
VSNFSRRIDVYAEDERATPLLGTDITWTINGAPAGAAVGSAGHCSFEVLDPSAVVTVSATFGGNTQGPVTLSNTQTQYLFRFPVTQHSEWKDFFMRHFPLILAVSFIIAAVALTFTFSAPTQLQRHIILALFSLGGGCFGGEISGFIKTDLTLGKKLTISAGGAAAIFVILYFFVPAGAQ